MAMTQRAARDLVADITAANGEGDHETAVRIAAWGVEAFPDAAVFHRLRGVALAALGSNEEAQADLHAALATDPLDHEALVTLSRIEEAEGDLYTAAEHLLTAWEHDPANGLLRSDLTYRLARLYGSEGYLQYTRPALAALYVRNAYPERAAREYAAALAEQPNRTDLRLASALARWRLGALAEAADGCVVLLGEQPNLVRARWVLADALARRGRGDEAREHARHAAHLDPDGAIARAMIEGNADATIVDPDETVRVPLDAPRPVAHPVAQTTAFDPAELPAAPAPPPLPPLPPPSIAEVAPPAIGSPALEEDLTEPFFVPVMTGAGGSDDETIDTTLADAPADRDTEMPPAAVVPDPEFTARAIAELDSFEQTIAALERTLAALNAAHAPRAAAIDDEDAEDTETSESAELPPAMSAVSAVPKPEYDLPPTRDFPADEWVETFAPPREGDAFPAVGAPPGGASPVFPPVSPIAPDNAFAPPTLYAEWDDTTAHASADAPLPVPEPFPESDAAFPSTIADVPPQPDEEPESVVAVVTEAGEVIADYPGGEPLLEDADAFPGAVAASEPYTAPAFYAPPKSFAAPRPRAASPPQFVTEPYAAPEPFAAPTPPTASEPPSAVEPAASHETREIREEPDAAMPAAPPFGWGTPPAMPTAPAAPPAQPPAAIPTIALGASLVPTPDELLVMVRQRIAAGDAAGAVGFGRAALVAAGKDTTHVRALLPAIRVLVEAVPDRPEARRLLGDTYRRLGQMSQAQGQYQQALLARVAGKK